LIVYLFGPRVSFVKMAFLKNSVNVLSKQNHFLCLMFV
jgi:hypothetical protein